MQNKSNGMVYAALIVIVLMGALIVVQQEQRVENLPFCEYSTVLQVQGHHEGYYVGMDANQQIVCAQPLTKKGTTVDLGL